MIERTLVKARSVSSWERNEFVPDEELMSLDARIGAQPDNAQLWLEKGLCLAGASLYREAGECYARAIALEPFNGTLYLHWAHRMLSQWRFEDACAGFVIASRLIPDRWEVWYHLGLAHFLLGQYAKAAEAYQRCLELSTRQDQYIAVCDWYYMTELRLGDRDAAEKLLDYISEDFDPGPNTAYFRRLLMYKGILSPEEILPADLGSLDALQLITIGFGLSNYYYFNGDVKKSNEILDMIIKAGDENDIYFAFGYLAAKVDKTMRSGTRSD